jgi:tRNA/rRNA methyltransferase
MKTESDLSALLSRVRWVMVSPTHPGNLGAAARALMATGFAQLAVANPVQADMQGDEQAVSMASGADDLLQNCRMGDLAELIGPCRKVVGFTARAREFEPKRIELEQAAQELTEWLAQDPTQEVAFVFGPERSGLTNADLARCSHLCSLDVNPAFSSLNLSQAMQVVAYLFRRAARQHLSVPRPVPQTPGAGRPTAKPASREMVAGLHDHLLRLSQEVGQLDPANPGRMDERLWRLWNRAEIYEDEVQLLRGFLSDVQRVLKRQG